MSKKKKKPSSTKLRKEEARWDAAKSATRNMGARGTKSISSKLMLRLDLLPSQGKEVEADIPDPRNEIDERLRLEGWKEIFKTLTERERVVIEHVYFQDLKVAEVCRMFKVTQERGRQIHMKALRKLRHPCRVELMRKFDIPIEEEWYPKKEITPTLEENNYIPPKPYWVKAEVTEDGVPYLAADSFYIWCIKPVTRKVYDAWLAQALEECETIR